MKNVLLLGLVLASCAKEAAPVAAAPAAVAPRDTTVRAELPVRATWEEVSRSANGAVVRATIERRLGMDMPFAVNIAVPAGVVVKKGRTQFSLMPNVEAVVVSEELELVWDGAVPSEDAVLKVDGDTGAMGIHFKVPYRFGRAEPIVEGPRATGPHVFNRGRDLGPSIPLAE